MKRTICAAVFLYCISASLMAACPSVDSLPISVNKRIEAIECYQHNGELRNAAVLLRDLTASPVRDTLTIRQLLLGDSLTAALHFTDSAVFFNRAPRDVQLLWRARLSLFGGKTDVCRALLDSACMVPSRPPASELLEYRYWLLRFADAPEALAKFIQIEYTLFKGDRESAAKRLCGAALDTGSAWRLAVRIARRQIDKSESAAALATLRCAPADNEPEYLYLLSRANAESGATEAARTLLERLMLEYPGNVYTVKGRLLLSRLPPKPKINKEKE